ncbi:MAG: helix-turn-helix transcriptional regulator [Gammaproteobacteria bacterium]
MTDTTLRYIKMLECIPPEPRKIAAKDVREQLLAAGHDISARSVERDLEKLAAIFPLVKDDRSRPFGWSWMRDASRVDIQPIDPVSALTLTLAHAHLAPLLPASVLKVLAPRFEAAERLLAGDGKELSRLPARIKVKSRGQKLAVPVIDHAILETIYDALQHNVQVKLTYGARKNDGRARQYDADPLGVVFVDGVVYFVCQLHSDESRIAHLPVQRIKAIKATTEPAQVPAGFDLDQFVDANFDYPVGNKPLKLVFRMDRATAAHLSERPLAKDQQVDDDGEAHCIVRATVRDTQQLRWWLLGFGDKVEVLEPASLRAEFRGIAEALAASYGQPAR